MSADGPHESATNTPAVAQGPNLPEQDLGPVGLIGSIRQRLALWPNARLWTVDRQGLAVSARYADLWRRSGNIATGLQRSGLGPGQVAALLIDDVRDGVAAAWACLRLGCIILPLNGRARRAQTEDCRNVLDEVLSQVPGVILLVDSAFRGLAGPALDLAAVEGAGEAAGGLALDEPPAEIACLVPTSGATGRVKLARLSDAVLVARRFRRRSFNPNASDVPLWIYDTDSVTGMNAAFIQAPDWVQIPPAAVLARPAVVLELMQHLRVTRLALTGSLASLIAQAAEAWPGSLDLSALRKVSMGGEAVDIATANRLHDALIRHGARQVRMTAGYGTTETGTLVRGAVLPHSAVAGATAQDLGRPAAGVALRVVDDAGRILREGDVGEVETHCPGLIFSGYADASESGFTDDGWWRTGDLGQLKAGRLSLHGRGKDVVSIRGRKLALGDIDTVLQAAADALAGQGVLRLVSCSLAIDGEALAVAVFGPVLDGKVMDRAVRGAMGHTFGVQPQRIVHLPLMDLPLGAGGKLLRRELAQRVALMPTMDRNRDLVSLWQTCLPLAENVADDSHFFEDGGDSLAAQQLFAGVEAQFNITLSPSAFFAEPTFGRLQALTILPATAMTVSAQSDDTAWPLRPAVRDKLLAAVESWPGNRVTPDRLMAGFNESGTRPPLFWVFQSGRECESLTRYLGPDQPVYGLRSGHGVYGYDEDSLQLVALRYVQDILAVCPQGPLFVGGNCQGGRVAAAMADHLLRRRVDVPVLFLMEWGFTLQPYHGDVVFLHGADSLEGNPWLRHEAPELAWQGTLTRWAVEVIPGRHGQYFSVDHAPGLAAVLSRHMARIRTPDVMPAAGRRAKLTAGPVPVIMIAAARHEIEVTLTNISPLAWPQAWGLRLGNYWLNSRDHVERWRDGRIALLDLAPGDSINLTLDIVAPSTPGRYSLVIDVVEEGGTWFDRRRRTAPVIAVEVI